MKWFRDNSPDIKALLAAERTIDPVSDEVRNRTLGRARKALLHEPRARIVLRPPAQRRWTVAALLIALPLAVFATSLHFASRQKITRPVPTVILERAPSLEPSLEATDPLVVLPAPSPETQSERAPARHTQKTRPSASAKDTTQSEAFAIELWVLDPAQRALARHDYTAALAAIADHQVRFPSGQLVEEREALRVKALLGLGRTREAEQAAAAFHQRFPASALQRRIDALLSSR